MKIDKIKISKCLGSFAPIFALCLILAIPVFGRKIIADIYITPRNVAYGVFDQGVFAFDLKEKCDKIKFNDRTYETRVKKRKVYELYYLKKKIDMELLNKLVETKTDSMGEFSHPRIAFFVHNYDKIDTFLFDNNMLIKHNNVTYYCNELVKEYIINLMPSDIRSNWVENLPQRTGILNLIR